MNTTETAKAVVLIDGKEAAWEIENLKKKSKELKVELDKAFKSGDKDLWKKLKKDADDLDASVKKIKATGADVAKVLKNLNGTNLKDLNSAQKQIIADLEKMERGTIKYAAKAADLQKVEAELTKVKIAMHGVTTTGGSMWSKAATGMNKYFLLLGSIVASLTGMVLGFKKLVTDFNLWEKTLANLSALTGLVGDSIIWLGDKAKELSTSMTKSGVKITSTADEIVNAFTKMGSAKPELLKDKEALAQVTEQALILKEACQGELEPNVESLANTMNQFGAKASQAAKYINVLAAGSKEGSAEVSDISDSIVKFGAAADAANVSVEESVALIETLAEKGIKGEIAGRGLRGVLLKLQTGADDTNPKIVGMSQALDTLAAKNLSAADMVKLFGEENYTAAQILIANADRFNYFTKAVTGTNVATEQAIINTSTNAAKLEQAKNKAHLMALELGEKLAPALTFSTNAFMYFLKAIVASIRFYKEHSTAINSIIIGLLAYTVAVKANAIMQGIFTAATKIATTAVKLFNGAVKANYLAMFVSVLVAVGTYLMLYKKKLDAATLAQEALADATLTAQKRIVEEKSSLEALMKIAKDEKQSKEDRLAAIKKINEISPEYLGNITLENINTKAATKSLTAYIAELERKYTVEALGEKITEEKKKQLDIENSKLEDNLSWYEKLWAGMKAASGNKNAITDLSTTALDNQKESLQESKDLVTELEKQMADLAKASDVLNSTGTDLGDDDSVSGAGDKVDALKDSYEKLNEQIAKYQKLQKAALADNDSNAATSYGIKIYQLQKEKEGIDLVAEALSTLPEKMEPIALAEKKLADLNTTYTADFITNTDLKVEAEKAAAAKRIELEKEVAAAKEEFVKKGIAAAAALLDIANNARYDKEMLALNAKYEADKAALEKQGLSQEKYNARLAILDKKKAKAELDIKRKQAKMEKAIALAKIVADTAQAIFKLTALAAVLNATPGMQGFGALALAQIPWVLGTAALESGIILAQPLPQAYSGKYPVIGASDGKTYNAGVVSNAKTGLLNSPTILAGEKPEIIIDPATTKRLQMDYPGILNAIYTVAGRMPQFASGNYPVQNSNSSMAPIIQSDPEHTAALKEFNRIVQSGILAKVVYTEFEEIQNKVDETRSKFGG